MTYASQSLMLCDNAYVIMPDPHDLSYLCEFVLLVTIGKTVSDSLYNYLSSKTQVWYFCDSLLIARFMWTTWGPSGADRTQVGPILAPWTLLSGLVYCREYLTDSAHCSLSLGFLGWLHYPLYTSNYILDIVWWLMSHKQVSRAGTWNYISQYL